MFTAADKAAHVWTERVPMRTILCPDMRGKFMATVNSNVITEYSTEIKASS